MRGRKRRKRAARRHGEPGAQKERSSKKSWGLLRSKERKEKNKQTKQMKRCGLRWAAVRTTPPLNQAFWEAETSTALPLGQLYCRCPCCGNAQWVKRELPAIEGMQVVRANLHQSSNSLHKGHPGISTRSRTHASEHCALAKEMPIFCFLPRTCDLRGSLHITPRLPRRGAERLPGYVPVPVKAPDDFAWTSPPPEARRARERKTDKLFRHSVRTFDWADLERELNKLHQKSSCPFACPALAAPLQEGRHEDCNVPFCVAGHWNILLLQPCAQNEEVDHLRKPANNV